MGLTLREGEAARRKAESEMTRKRNDPGPVDEFEDAGAKAFGRADGQETLIRWDPKGGSEAGAAGMNMLEGKDPSRHYVWVPLRATAPQFHPTAYRRRGYRFEVLQEGGPRLAFEDPDHPLKTGEMIVDGFENALMSCSIEQFIENTKADPISGVGQERIGQIEKQILRGNPTGTDPMRGIHGEHTRLVSKPSSGSGLDDIGISPEKMEVGNIGGVPGAHSLDAEEI